MAKQTINTGTTANDRSGDTLRSAFTKINANFTELYNTASADVQIPSQTSNNGKYLTTNGTTLSWGTVTAGADLGYFKIQGEYLGTKDNPDTGNWGGHWMYIDSGGESNAGISIPSVASQTTGGELTIYNNHADGGAIRFLTNTGEWKLNQEGTMQFPSNTIDAGTNSIDLKSASYAELWYHGADGEWQASPLRNSNAWIWTAYDGTFIENARDDDGLGGQQWNYQWEFGNDGSTTFPIDLKFERVGMGWPGLTTHDQAISLLAQGTGDYAESTLGGITVGGSGGAGVTSIEANNHAADPALYASWSFQPEGRISFPYRTGNARTGDGENLQFIKSNDQKIISTAAGNVDFPGVERLVIAGGDSYYDGTGYPSGEAGDIYLWAGRGFNGGDIKVDAGNSLSDQEGGTIKIRGGSSDSGQGGFVEIWSGSGTTGANITLSAWNGGGWNQWIFEPHGNLTLPSGGDIKNYDGFSVIKSIPQNQQNSASDYTLVLSDAGKHIYKNDGEGYSVVVPTNADVAFEIGTAVTVVSGDSWTYIYPADGETTAVWGAGFNQTSTAWYIPNNSMATLLKIGTDKWMLSGAGLAEDI